MSYTGPGDLETTWHCWYGLRAFSSTVAAAGGATGSHTGNKAIQITRASDSTTRDIYILNTGALDTADAAAFLTATTGKITTWYDQGGSGFNLPVTTSNGFTYGTGTSGLGAGQPSAQIADGSLYTNTTGEGFSGQPFSMSWYIERTTSGTTYTLCHLGGGNVFISPNTAANSWAVAAGTTINETVSDASFHAVNVVFNGASGSFTVDSSTTASQNFGAFNPGFQPFTVGDGTNSMPGFLCEFGIQDKTMSAPVTLGTNQNNYWTSAIPGGGGATSLPGILGLASAEW